MTIHYYRLDLFFVQLIGSHNMREILPYCNFFVQKVPGINRTAYYPEYRFFRFRNYIKQAFNSTISVNVAQVKILKGFKNYHFLLFGTADSFNDTLNGIDIFQFQLFFHELDEVHFAVNATGKVNILDFSFFKKIIDGITEVG